MPIFPVFPAIKNKKALVRLVIFLIFVTFLSFPFPVPLKLAQYILYVTVSVMQNAPGDNTDLVAKPQDSRSALQQKSNVGKTTAV